MICTLSMTPGAARQAAVGHVVSELEGGNSRAAVWLGDARVRPTAEELAAAREPYRRAEAQADAAVLPPPSPGIPSPLTKPRKVAKPVEPARTLGDRIVKEPPVSLNGPRKVVPPVCHPKPTPRLSLRQRLARTFAQARE